MEEETKEERPKYYRADYDQFVSEFKDIAGRPLRLEEIDSYFCGLVNGVKAHAKVTEAGQVVGESETPLLAVISHIIGLQKEILDEVPEQPLIITN